MASEYLTSWNASNERVAREFSAATDGIVIDHLTRGSNSARSEARVYALLIAASFRQRTLGTDGALRPARRRNTEESRHARAHRLPVVFPANAVGSARRGQAGISFRNVYIRHENDGSCISYVSKT